MKIVLLFAAVAACALAAEPLVAHCRSQNRNWMYESVLPDRPWGADRWGGMCPEWAACDGPMQSPIDLSVQGARGVARHMDFDYRAQSSVAMFNTGRAIKIPFSKAGDAPGLGNRGEGGNSISRNGEVYYLREVQFHTPSEHRVNGVEFDLEIQFIHDAFYESSPSAPVNNHAVVSVFYNRGMHSWFLDQLFFDLPEFDHCWCGNNRLESFAPFGEECDNGERNADVADACRTNCTLPRCGDGIVDKCEQCDDGAANSDATADACRTNCVRAACGDGVLDSEEECDDGNRHNLDGCSSICKLECGDGFENTDPRCDPDLVNPDDCDIAENQCQPGQFPWRNECSGYNWPNGVEECDDVDTIGAPNGCRAGCRNSFCGDGILDDAPVGRAAEECDGSANCLPTCVENVCNDGVMHGDEECDDGLAGNIDDTYDPITGAFVSGGSGCSSNCTRVNINGEPFCGDGNLQQAIVGNAYYEQCDEGPLNSQQANAFCREDCTEARCGDSIVDAFPNSTRPGEQCDDGAANGMALPHHPGAADCVPGSTCTVRCDDSCTLRCGNGIIEPAFGEECDNTETDNQSADSICRPWCRLAFCGDGIVDPVLGEDCDDGDLNDDAGRCTTLCQRPVCGDGNVNFCVYGEEIGSNCADPAAECRCVLDLANEECDNGVDNAQSAECNTDCRLNCGNGRIDDNEECDDGFDNSMSAANACRPFYTDRAGAFLRCVKHVCGDGVTDDGEQCDDGNSGSATCRADCTLPYCGDGIADAAFGEECDNGAMNSDVDDADDACSMDCVLNRCRRNVKTFAEPLDFEMAFPMHNHSSICYKGSLTAPPCTTATNWVVFEQPQQMSVLQFEQLRSVLPHAGSEFEGQAAKRPLQPIGDVDSRRIRFCDDVSMAPAHKCGNGIEEAGEACDHGLGNSDSQSDACRTNCQVAKCGDGVVDMGAGEECEPPSTNGCDASCHFPERRVNPRNPQKWNYKRSGDWWMSESDCDGDKQSPIDVRRDHTKDFGDADTNYVGTQLQINYGTNENVNLFNTGERAVWTVDGANTITIADEGVYTLSHITLHHPSEHTIEGKSADFEVQYHHQQGETWASIAVLYDVSEMRSAFLDQFFFHMPRSSMPMCGNGKIEDDVAWWSEECDDGHLNSDFKPNACRTNCKRPTCGDGVVDRGEMCDDGVWNSGDVDESLLTRAGRADACRVQCVLPFCGDGILDSNEQCDDGNNVDGDGCSKKCTQECGDGSVGVGEDCDDGADNSNTHPNACRVVRVCNPLVESPATCNPYDNGVRLCRSASCGDGVVDAGEDCDLGLANGDTPNGCRSDCSLPTCGDGVTDFAFGNEQCDDASDSLTCFANCTLKCGDGLLQAGEECDAGEANSDTEANACRSSCLSPTCGDGVVDAGEWCDHGGFPTVFCLANCQQGCGNGVPDAGEECDDGTGNNNGEPNCCRFDCTAPSCGDGILDAGEECDEAAANGSPASHCNALCRLKRCGDGEHWVGVEECDGTPGCSPTCRLLCGNGLKDAGEQCDDGDDNSNAPGACRPDCTLPRCGDGFIDHMMGEQCDSGAANANAPNACRPDCTLPTCGDDIVDSAYGEQCDDGSAVNSDINNDFGDSNACSCDCKYAHYGRSRVTGADLSMALPTLKSKSVYCYEGSGPYDGSLRRPPCNERALWIVYAEVQHMSMRQAHDFMDVFAAPSSRGVQCSEGRDVEYKTVGQTCGNCKREGTEECDDGELNSDTKSGACRTNCRRSMCGDGVVDHTEGEQCEPLVHDGCDEFCRWMTSCPVSASGGSCPNNSCGASCASGSCSNAQQVPQDSTVINVNFANMLSKSACTTCSR